MVGTDDGFRLFIWFEQEVMNMSVIIPPLSKVDLRGPVSWAAHSSWSQSRPWYIVDV